MRKTQKQEIETLLGQMEEAHEQIKEYIEQGSIPPAMELLEDCQTGGVTVGTLIESTEGEGHSAVVLLEDYCELVYQIYQKLEEDYKEVNKNNFGDQEELTTKNSKVKVVVIPTNEELVIARETKQLIK